MAVRTLAWVVAAAAAIAGVVMWFGAARRPVMLVAVGDVLLDRGVARRVARDGHECLTEAIWPFLRDADIAVCNLECPLASGRPAAAKPIIFGGPAEGASWLREAGFDAVSLANNHALDQGRDGLMRTMAGLDRAGVAWFGAGTNQAEASRPRIIRCRSKRVALLGFTVFPDEGVFFNPSAPGTARADPTAIRRAVRLARDLGDLVIVSFHWGNEFQNLTSDAQRRIGRLAVDSGADIVVGHHPHVIQGAEVYRGGLIAYSVGNFVFDQHRRGANHALLLRATFHRRTTDVSFEPVLIADCLPVRPDEQHAQEILRRFRSLCDGLDTHVSLTGGSASIRLPARGRAGSADNY